MVTKSLLSRLPNETIRQMTRAQIVLLDLLLDLMCCTSRHAPSGAFYAFPSQKFLASRLGMSRPWVSRSVGQLAAHGLIHITHRRKVQGCWKTNLYRAGAALKNSFKATTSRFISFLSRVNLGAHIVKKKQLVFNNERSEDNLKPPNKGHTWQNTLQKALLRLKDLENYS